MAAAMAHRAFASWLLSNVCWIASPSRRVTAAEIQPRTLRMPDSSSLNPTERSIGGRTMMVSRGASEWIVRGTAIHLYQVPHPVKAHWREFHGWNSFDAVSRFDRDKPCFSKQQSATTTPLEVSEVDRSPSPGSEFPRARLDHDRLRCRPGRAVAARPAQRVTPQSRRVGWRNLSACARGRDGPLSRRELLHPSG